MEPGKLIELALEARESAYCPYSNWAVGAALLSKDGQVIKGCNIESASYTPTNCAERTAMFKAVSEGIKQFDAIAIVGGPKGKAPISYCGPCGVCRQVLMEFCDPKNFKIYVAMSPTDYKEYTLEEMLPLGFGPADLGLPVNY